MCGAKPPPRQTPAPAQAAPVAAAPEPLSGPDAKTPTKTTALVQASAKDALARSKRKVNPTAISSTSDQIGVQNTLGSG
jgi:hypothetical protein